MADRLLLTLGILGGTGREGMGLAYRWARAGYPILIGSRSLEKAQAAADALNQRLGEDIVQGRLNAEAASSCDIAILTVPYAAHRTTLDGLRDQLQGKILVDVTNPVQPPHVGVVFVPEAGSAAQEAQEVLGEAVQVVSAFQNISHELLMEKTTQECDVLVTGDDPAAREQVIELARAAGLDGWDAGPLKNAIVAEGMTSVLIGINKRYGMKGAGIRITGSPSPRGG
jgi:NADPH-dependent F420 reductase